MTKEIEIKDARQVERINQLACEAPYEVWLHTDTVMLDARSLLGLFVGRHTLPMCRSAHESGRGDRKCGYTSVLTRRSAETR